MYANIGRLYRNVHWSVSDSMNAYACILMIYLWNFVGDYAWGGGVPAQKIHFVTPLLPVVFWFLAVRYRCVNNVVNALHSGNKALLKH